ncbi:MAG TPA: hypothetical protein VFY18_13095 [Candidatus Limnocylindrales bacterium]|nr:hypothetical protein [Candidatus Limnocylindrales bacterium]
MQLEHRRSGNHQLPPSGLRADHGHDPSDPFGRTVVAQVRLSEPLARAGEWRGDLADAAGIQPVICRLAGPAERRGTLEPEVRTQLDEAHQACTVDDSDEPAGGLACRHVDAHGDEVRGIGTRYAGPSAGDGVCGRVARAGGGDFWAEIGFVLRQG